MTSLTTFISYQGVWYIFFLININYVLAILVVVLYIKTANQLLVGKLQQVAFHQICESLCRIIIGNGVVVHLPGLFEEAKKCEKKGN